MRNISQEVRLKSTEGFYKRQSSRGIVRLARKEINLMLGWQNLSSENLEGSIILLLTTLCSIATTNSEMNAKSFVQIMDTAEPEEPKTCAEAVRMARKYLRPNDSKSLTCYKLALAARVLKKYSDEKIG